MINSQEILKNIREFLENGILRNKQFTVVETLDSNVCMLDIAIENNQTDETECFRVGVIKLLNE